MLCCAHSVYCICIWYVNVDISAWFCILALWRNINILLKSILFCILCEYGVWFICESLWFNICIVLLECVSVNVTTDELTMKRWHFIPCWTLNLWTKNSAEILPEPGYGMKMLSCRYFRSPKFNKLFLVSYLYSAVFILGSWFFMITQLNGIRCVRIIFLRMICFSVIMKFLRMYIYEYAWHSISICCCSHGEFNIILFLSKSS